jgi:exodeoxyribonuclease-5
MAEWSPQQEMALKRFLQWYNCDPKGEYFRLFGVAGSGKTFCAKGLAEAIGRPVLFAAYTGKAALVMQKKGCPNATTIHALMYTAKGKSRQHINELTEQIAELGEDGDPEVIEALRFQLREENARQSKPSFNLNPDSPIRDAPLVVIDECSMVDRYIGEDLMSFGTPVLALGDPAQLPPVKGHSFFEQDNPDVMLTEVHRTALDSPVLRLATMVRLGEDIRHGNYGDSCVVRPQDLSPGSGLSHDQVLVGLNKTRRMGNTKMMRQLGFTGIYPEGPKEPGGKGSRVVCLRNNRENGLLNGMLFDVLKAEDDGESIHMDISPDGGGTPISVTSHREHFVDREKDIPWYERRNKDEFDFGYALTVHKAQGSEWPSVFIIDESPSFRADRDKWLYTAITRASKRVTIVRR